MKQFQFIYQNDGSFREEIDKIRRWCGENPAYTTLFRIYSEDMDLEHIRHVCDLLDQEMPEALYLGCTTQGNILNGGLEKANIILSCTVFEYETTQVKVLQIPFSEANAKEAVSELKACCNLNPWVSSVEVHATVLGMSMAEFCQELSTLREDIQVFGGGACNPDANDMNTFVFSKGSGFSSRSAVFLLLGGSDLYTYSTYISGWKPMGRKFKITKAHREILQELDGQPAFNIYQRFLNIAKSDKLVTNTLEFPLFMDYKGTEVLRCPLMVMEDNALIMTSEVIEDTDVRLAYGDPGTILTSIRRDGQKIANFQPEVIQTFSCAARRAFWGDESISDETVLVNSVAPTSGFYTGGEFLRIASGVVCHFNITLVFAAMREGAPKIGDIVNIDDTRLDHIENDRIPLIWRFVSFIEQTTTELEEMGGKLALSSVTDGLTGLYNRAEIERRIRHATETSGDLSLIMLDIDDFKHINDVYGHKEGDNVIIALAEALRKVTAGADVSLGRWGGEEFMVLLPFCDAETAMALAEQIRAEFEAVTYELAGRQTISVGVSRAKPGEDADTLYSRVDEALYAAKTGGKNRVVKL